jgi:peptide/nickel transport system ATP-binding protein
MSDTLLQVKNLKLYYYTEKGAVKAVDDVSFDLPTGTRLGLVGESGCGKTTLAMGILRLFRPPARIVEGQVLLGDVDLAKLPSDQMRQIRLKELSLIPQGAMNSLNPVMRIKQQIIDGIQAHDTSMSQQALMQRVYEVLESVDLPRAVADMFPHELSGGMKQRVCVAIAICMRPKLVIADEPTSALDVVVQRQVMETIGRLQKDLGLSVILIGHDMGLMAQFVDRLAIMYAGKMVELANMREIFKEPLHPYTRMLINTLPTLEVKGVFRGIPGITPSLLNAPDECLFRPRCPDAAQCPGSVPDMKEVRPGRWVACHLHEVQK